MVLVKLLSIIDCFYQLKKTISGENMRNKLFLFLMIACAVFIISACTTFQASGLQVGMSQSGTEVLGNFTTTVYINKFLGASGVISAQMLHQDQ